MNSSESESGHSGNNRSSLFNIESQRMLPVTVAFEVVLQGLRTRLGRSLVTLLGVALGIAFLMSVLTSGMIRNGVSSETAARTELRRMLSFLTAETGPLRGLTINVIDCGPMDDMERRFLDLLESEGSKVIHGAGNRQCDAALLAGDGARPRAITPARVVASTRLQHAQDEAGKGQTVILQRELQPDELRQAAMEERRTRFRTAWVVIIALLVTAIGISNAMLMSVTERFREIGTMKCLGALSAFIRQVFFIESLLMGLCGSIAGCMAGAVLTFAAYSISYGAGLTLAAVSLPSLALFAAVSMVCGIVLSVVAAVYPATVAARMVPANALRSTV